MCADGGASVPCASYLSLLLAGRWARIAMIVFALRTRYVGIAARGSDGTNCTLRIARKAVTSRVFS